MTKFAMTPKQASFAKSVTRLAQETQTEPRDALVVFGHMAGLLVAFEMNINHRTRDEAVAVCQALFDQGMASALAALGLARTTSHH